MKFFIYCRKSSEDGARQIQSIGDQVRIMSELAVNHKLTIVEVYEESASAKDPGRPKFNEMMDRLEQGEAEGILCWNLDRLARNPLDSGRINWILDQGIIKKIITPEKSYLPGDNVLMMTLEFGMAHEFINNLSKNVKRGQNSKLLKGGYPGTAPVGYLNELEYKTIQPDPERWDMVRKMWDMLLSGNYSVPKIVEIANKEWSFRTKPKRKSGGTPLNLSSTYKLFRKPFYYGEFYWNSELHKGKHKAMITKEEFDRAQEMIGTKRITAASKDFAFTGLIRCGECGCMVTAEERIRKNKTNDNVRHYIYYHCSHRRDSKRDTPCSNRTNIRKEDIEAQIEVMLKCVYISPSFRDWAFEILSSSKEQREVEREEKVERHKTAIRSIDTKLDNLLRMKIGEMNSDGILLSDEEYKKEKTSLLTEKNRVESGLESTMKDESPIDLLPKVFDIASKARAAFESGDSKTRKAILRSIFKGFTLKGTLIEPIFKLPFEILADGLKQNPLLDDKRFEPTESFKAKEESHNDDAVLMEWQGQQESNPRQGFWRPVYYHYTMALRGSRLQYLLE